MEAVVTEVKAGALQGQPGGPPPRPASNRAATRLWLLARLLQHATDPAHSHLGSCQQPLLSLSDLKAALEYQFTACPAGCAGGAAVGALALQVRHRRQEPLLASPPRGN